MMREHPEAYSTKGHVQLSVTRLPSGFWNATSTEPIAAGSTWPRSVPVQVNVAAAPAGSV